MNTIIVYSSKYGCTAECSEYLKARLPGSAALFNIGSRNSQPINLEDYDTVLLGSPIYIGAISKTLQLFCKEKMDLLSKKRVGLFLCCAFPEQTNEYLTRNFPPRLLKNALVAKSFGGEARIGKMKAVDKMIMKAATKGDTGRLKISYGCIDSFIEEISR